MGDGVLSRGNHGLEKRTCGCVSFASSDLPRLLVTQQVLNTARMKW